MDEARTLQKQAEGDILLASEGTQELSGPAETGTGKAEDEKELLSNLIQVINDRFGTDFDAQDLVDGVIAQMVEDDSMQQSAEANTRENFEYVAGPAFEKALIDRHAKHGRFIDRVYSDEELLKFLKGRVLDEVYRRLSESEAAAAP